MYRRTKIVATLGPMTSSYEQIRDLLQEKVDVVRVNFSHGTYAEHESLFKNVRTAAAELKIEVAIMADMQGPKIRISSFKNTKVMLQKGQKFTFDPDVQPNMGDENSVGIEYKNLYLDVTPGKNIVIGDGQLSLIVDEIQGQKVICTVLETNEISNNKGINITGGGISAGAITKKDLSDIEDAVSFGADFIALSFVKTADDIEHCRKLLKKLGSSAAIIAKIERTEAVQNLRSIMEATDAIMVARGDLAIEVGVTEVPGIQKNIIKMAKEEAKPVIVATQMMESMINCPVPTRAEVSDVANAVMDGADAVMLSGETAVGMYPNRVVATVAKVCSSAEHHNLGFSNRFPKKSFFSTENSIANTAIFMANNMNVSAILALTESGRTTLWMSRIRSGIPIYGLSRNISSVRKMKLYRDVYPIYFDYTSSAYGLVNYNAVKLLESLGLVKSGDNVILTKGDYMGVEHGSNAIKVLEVGNVRTVEEEVN